MAKYDSLLAAANREMKNTDVLLSNDDTPFHVIYAQYKTLQSLWFRLVEDASISNSRKLEDMCVNLEEHVQTCKEWVDRNSKNENTRRKGS